MGKRLALAGVLVRVAPDHPARVLDWRTDLLTGQPAAGLVFGDLDRPGPSIADELDAAVFRARAGQAHREAAGG